MVSPSPPRSPVTSTPRRKKAGRAAICPEPVLAVLDPATPWCILNWEVARVLGISLAGETLRLRTWWGTVEGELHRLVITLLAEEGEPVSTEKREDINGNQNEEP